MYEPLGGPSATGGVTFSFTIGGCVLSGVFTVDGHFTQGLLGNYCSDSGGTLSVAGHSLNWVNSAETWALSGGGAGALKVTANTAARQSCLTGATSFTFSGQFSTF